MARAAQPDKPIAVVRGLLLHRLRKQEPPRARPVPGLPRSLRRGLEKVEHQETRREELTNIPCRIPNRNIKRNFMTEKVPTGETIHAMNAFHAKGHTRCAVFPRIQLLSSALRNFMSSRTTLRVLS